MFTRRIIKNPYNEKGRKLISFYKKMVSPILVDRIHICENCKYLSLKDSNCAYSDCNYKENLLKKSFKCPKNKF
jgi:hypothetical protein